MRKTKKKRLEAAGWRVGSTTEFLNLTPGDAAFVELKIALADSLRARRRKQSLTQVQLAELVDSSPSRIAKMEAADPTVTIDLIIRSLLALGASPKDLARIIRSLTTNPALNKNTVCQ